MAISPRPASARPICLRRSRPMPPPNWPANYTARPSGRASAWRRWPFATSTCSDHGKIPASQYSAVIPLFITAILAGRQPVIYGNGRQSRDFCFVANVVHANLLAADAPEAVGRTINAANGRSIDLLALLGRAEPTVGHEGEAEFSPAAARRRPRKPGRHQLGPATAPLRAASRLRRGPAAIDRLLSASGGKVIA